MHVPEAEHPSELEYDGEQVEDCGSRRESDYESGDWLASGSESQSTTRPFPISTAAQTVDDSVGDAANRVVDELDVAEDGRDVKAAALNYRDPECMAMHLSTARPRERLMDPDELNPGKGSRHTYF